jgi:hypothetical protein
MVGQFLHAAHVLQYLQLFFVCRKLTGAAATFMPMSTYPFHFYIGSLVSITANARTTLKDTGS